MTNLRLNRGELAALIQACNDQLESDFMFADTDMEVTGLISSMGLIQLILVLVVFLIQWIEICLE